MIDLGLKYRHSSQTIWALLINPKDILEKVHFNRNPGLPLDILHDDFWKYKEQLHKYSNSFSPAFMEPSCNVSFVDGKPQFAIYLPYLHWCDDKYQKEQAKALEAFRSSSKGLKDEYALSKMDPSKRLRSAALTDTGDLRHHPRRTLDQYYYRNGTDTRMRDDDQIVSHPDKDKLLMVDQLWIFVTCKLTSGGFHPRATQLTNVDAATDTIFTFFPRNDPTKHPQRTDASLADLKKSLDDEISKCTEDHRCRYNAYEMAARCLYHAVTVLLAQRIQSEFNVMNIFQDVIAETKEKAVQSLNTFVRDQDTDIPISITTELNILLKASDLEDELSILAYLFRQQKKVMQSFKKLLHFNDLDRDQPTYSNSSSEFIYARHIVDKALQRLEDYREDLKQRQEEAGSTRALLLSTLDLKQKKANLEEAKRTLEMAKASGEQGRAMMIFTVFTVVFLPLSFFTSMYGMNIKEWSGADTNVSGKTVAIYTGSISVAVILMALFVAFGVVRLKRVYERVRRGFRASNLRAPRRRDEDEEGYDLISL